MNVQGEDQGRAPVRMHDVLTPLGHLDVTVNLDLLLHGDPMCVYGLGLNNINIVLLQTKESQRIHISCT